MFVRGVAALTRRHAVRKGNIRGSRYLKERYIITVIKVHFIIDLYIGWILLHI